MRKLLKILLLAIAPVAIVSGLAYAAAVQTGQHNVHFSGLSLAGGTLASGATITFGANAKIGAPASGNVQLTNAAATDFGLLILGPATSAGVAWKKVGTSISARTGADDAPVAVVALQYTLSSNAAIRSGNGDPEGLYSAPVGSLFMRADGGAGTTLYVKESGTGNTGWVAK